jgi:alpha-ketoglutarate-dependent taurine dioxygenase
VLVDNSEVVRLLTEEQRLELSSSLVAYSAREAKYYSGDQTVTHSPLTKHPLLDVDTLFIGLNASDDPALNFHSYFVGLNDVESGRRMKWLSDLFAATSRRYEHVWQEGDVLLIDNFLVSHGRNAMRPSTSRKLLRYSLQVTSDFYS